jgi:hypothetical protein
MVFEVLMVISIKTVVLQDVMMWNFGTLEKHTASMLMVQSRHIGKNMEYVSWPCMFSVIGSPIEKHRKEQ